MKTSIKCIGVLTVILMIASAIISLNETKKTAIAQSSEQYQNSELEWL